MDRNLREQNLFRELSATERADLHNYNRARDKAGLFSGFLIFALLSQSFYCLQVIGEHHSQNYQCNYDKRGIANIECHKSQKHCHHSYTDRAGNRLIYERSAFICFHHTIESGSRAILRSVAALHHRRAGQLAVPPSAYRSPPATWGD